MRKQFEIEGIVRNTPGSVVEDFSCCEILNLRNKGNVWRPTGVKNPIIGFPNPMSRGFNKMFIHTFGVDSYLVCYSSTTGEICAVPFPKDTYDSIIVINAIPVAFNQLTFQANTESASYLKYDVTIKYQIKGSDKKGAVVLPAGQPAVSVNTNFSSDEWSNFYAFIDTPVIEKTCYLINNGDKNTWNIQFPDNYIIGNVGANMNVKFTSLANFLIVNTDKDVFYFINTAKIIDTYEYNDYHLLPDIPDFMLDIAFGGSDGSSRSTLEGLWLIVAACQTVTGEYISLSNIILGTDEVGSHTVGIIIRLIQEGAPKKFIDLFPDEWKGIISNISIFITSPEVIYQRTGGDFSISEYLSKYGGIFRRLGIIDATTEFVESPSSGILYSLNIPEKDTLNTYTVLPSVDVHKHFSIKSYSFNSRLFIGDVYDRLHKSYMYQFKRTVSSGSDYYCFKTIIKTDEGYFDVCSDINHVWQSGGNSFVPIPSILMYSDRRAIKIQLLHLDNNTSPQTAKVGLEWDLSPLADLNIAVCPINPFPINDPARVYYYDNGYSAGLFIGSSESTYNKEPDVIPHYPNKVKASSLLYPFVWPLESTYSVGNKGVIGFATNNLSIDASNFGVYPLFVFTEEGIYALQLGVDVVVQKIAPLSGDVCVNEESISNIGYATVYASKNGLMLLQGQKSSKVTTLLEDYSKNPLSGNKHFEAILSKNGITSNISSTDIETFVKNAKSFLNYDENELVVTNEGYPYCYVYSFEAKKFFKIAERFYNVITDYPKSYGTDINGFNIYEISTDHYYHGNRRVLVQTNPFKLNTDDFEMLRRINARIRISGDDISIPSVGAYLFVSNDARKWAIVDAKEIGGDATNFNYLSAPASVKYGMLVLTGSVNMVNDYISHVTAEFEQRYNNKVR